MTASTRVGALGAMLALLLCCCIREPCTECPTGCRNGLVTVGLVLTPPGCGTQCETSFCPGGCSADGGTCLARALDDGGSTSCLASLLSATQGLLTAGKVAVSQQTTVVLATSAALACQLTSDAGLLSPGPGAAALTLVVPAGVGGMLPATPANGLAFLTTWSDGGMTRGPARSGSVFVNVVQPGGGLIGTYSLVFDTGTEEGSFTAPTCDVCATPP